MGNRTEVDAIVALAGILCLVLGAFYAFGFGGFLILFGLILLLLSAMEFTKSVVLTKEEQEVARFSFPRETDPEEAYRLYAQNRLKAEARGDIKPKSRGAAVWINEACATYIVNFRIVARNFRTIARSLYQKVQSVRMK